MKRFLSGKMKIATPNSLGEFSHIDLLIFLLSVVVRVEGARLGARVYTTHLHICTLPMYTPEGTRGKVLIGLGSRDQPEESGGSFITTKFWI